MNSFAADLLRHTETAVRPATLLIGYGNLLRSDDGAGAALVSRLRAAFFDDPYCACLTPHQLTPEIAEALMQARRVLFFDASLTVPPGKVKIRQISAEFTAGATNFSHRVAPESVLAIAQNLFGATPRAWSVAIGVSNLSVGDRLSPAVAWTVSRLSRRLAYRVRKWSALSSQLPTSPRNGVPSRQ